MMVGDDNMHTILVHRQLNNSQEPSPDSGVSI